MQGHSTLPNRVMANVFCEMGLIESWGTGLRRIKSLAEDFNLPPPEFIDSSIAFRVNLFRKTALNDEHQTGSKTSEELRNNFGENSESLRRNFGETEEVSPQDHRNTTEVSPQDLINNLTSAQLKIIEIIKSDASISVSSVAEQSGIPKRTVEFNVKKLK